MGRNLFIMLALTDLTATGLRAEGAGGVARNADWKSTNHRRRWLSAQEPLSPCKPACYGYSSADREDGRSRASELGSGPGSPGAAIAGLLVVPSQLLAVLSPRARNLVALLSYFYHLFLVVSSTGVRSIVAFPACLTLANRVDCGRISQSHMFHVLHDLVQLSSVRHRPMLMSNVERSTLAENRHGQSTI